MMVSNAASSSEPDVACTNNNVKLSQAMTSLNIIESSESLTHNTTNVSRNSTGPLKISNARSDSTLSLLSAIREVPSTIQKVSDTSTTQLCLLHNEPLKSSQSNKQICIPWDETMTDLSAQFKNLSVQESQFDMLKLKLRLLFCGSNIFSVRRTTVYSPLKEICVQSVKPEAASRSNDCRWEKRSTFRNVTTGLVSISHASNVNSTRPACFIGGTKKKLLFTPQPLHWRPSLYIFGFPKSKLCTHERKPNFRYIHPPECDGDSDLVNRTVSMFHGMPSIGHAIKVYGDQLYDLNKFHYASLMYTIAIELCPGSSRYYAMRSRCYTKLFLKYSDEAYGDAQKAIDVDPHKTSLDGYISMIQYQVACGDFNTAYFFLRRILDHNTSDSRIWKVILDEVIEIYGQVKDEMSAGHYDDALSGINSIIQYIQCDHACPISFNLYALRAECNIMLRNFKASKADFTYLSKLEESRERMFLQGLSHFKKEKYKKAKETFLVIESNHSKASELCQITNQILTTIRRSNKAFRRGDWQKALDLCIEGLSIEKTSEHFQLKLHRAISAARVKLKDFKGAIEACSTTLKIDEYCAKSLRRRALCHVELGQWSDAVADLEHLCSDFGFTNPDLNRRLLHEARMKMEVFNENYRIAEKLNLDGNAAFERRNYSYASSRFTHAIKLNDKKAEYYSNRAVCYTMLQKYDVALKDAHKAVELDWRNATGYTHMAKCYIKLGEISCAQRAVDRLKKIGDYGLIDEIRVVEILIRLEKEHRQAVEEHDHERALKCISQCLEHSPSSFKFKLAKAESLAWLGKYAEARSIAESRLKIDKKCIDALYVKGICCYYEDTISASLKYFSDVLSLVPDHKKLIALYKKAKSFNEAFTKGDLEIKTRCWSKALRIYNEARQIDATHAKNNAKIHTDRGIALYYLNWTKRAADSFTAALELNSNLAAALRWRARCYTDLGEYEDAVEDYNLLRKMDPNDDIKKLLNDAKQKLDENRKNRDFYEILGVPRNASADAITKAYRERAKECHPDKHPNASAHERQRQERRFKAVGEAYGVLKDRRTRNRYDNGRL